jgi:hypothetical protein
MLGREFSPQGLSPQKLRPMLGSNRRPLHSEHSRYENLNLWIILLPTCLPYRRPTLLPFQSTALYIHASSGPGRSHWGPQSSVPWGYIGTHTRPTNSVTGPCSQRGSQHSAVSSYVRFRHAATFRKCCTAQTNMGNGSHSPAPAPRSDPAGHKLLSAHLVHTAPAVATPPASTSAHAAALSLSASVSWTRPHLHTTNRQQRNITTCRAKTTGCAPMNS